ncbi:Hypothetical protein DEACI_1012 [Acididesulfobacillus acetoxydans]|uniref:Uncharacterized protein n=1 Tax=Acididesulfobacillus acetoxydans TaxID=1561005 RepID=A0A8S0W746_9FIRM|nr:hypothetical protein [Acididesulfobacillus acetoxydans]CAA7600359.1 Hypothetical protein DEACI_1012 [Acididesulfobacillus acetoxydans]CEJ07881.1 Hypothetical protein DEACI_2349 [Acididesulfobacillus acetoxydans]
MLGKLLKYEMRATGRTLLPLFLSLLLVAGISRLLFGAGHQKWDVATVISLAVYAVIMAGMFVMTFVVMIQRFYRNLLSDEGYLMFTLPVKPWKHIVSKLLVSMMWIVVSVAVALVSIIIVNYRPGAWTKMITFSGGLGSSAHFLAFIVSALVSLAAGILLIYASIAIGHLVNRHKVLASFAGFIVLNTLTQIVGQVFRSLFHTIQVNSGHFAFAQARSELAIACAIAFMVLLSAAYFAVTNHILAKRLNLE